ncbi:MAG: 3'(2'),5'-bisphosphate nucleotidase CysQ [Hyphomicrobiales bacterium]|nr:3'(2'),5'-bisphosphate nucleotidase CysQ [Hyphomicrobiales bacterium]
MPVAKPDLGLAAELVLLSEAVRAAGAAALKFYGNEPRVWHKDDRSPVSEADHAADAVLKNRLTAARPAYGWMSEESGHVAARGPQDRLWIVDPIDGTRAYLKGRAEWAVSAALVEKGRPIAACVFNPAAGLFFTAMKGGGAHLNGAAIRASNRASIAGARMLAHDSGLRGRRWRLPWPDMELHRVNSIAYRICLVASGKYDAALSGSNKSDWDLAAADLIVHEAGGRISAFNGVGFVYNRVGFRHQNVVCAGARLHAKLISHIKAAIRP